VQFSSGNTQILIVLVATCDVPRGPAEMISQAVSFRAGNGTKIELRFAFKIAPNFALKNRNQTPLFGPRQRRKKASWNPKLRVISAPKNIQNWRRKSRANDPKTGSLRLAEQTAQTVRRSRQSPVRLAATVVTTDCWAAKSALAPLPSSA